MNLFNIVMQIYMRLKLILKIQNNNLPMSCDNWGVSDKLEKKRPKEEIQILRQDTKGTNEPEAKIAERILVERKKQKNNINPTADGLKL